MVTDVPGIALCWSFGDCAPVLLYDPRHEAVALIHSGWRGAAAGIRPEHLEDVGLCTGCRTDLFYSHRREPKPSGRFVVAVGLLPAR